MHPTLGAVVRLSDWEAALSVYQTIQALPVPDTELMHGVQQAYSSRELAAPERERQFTLATLRSPISNATDF